MLNARDNCEVVSTDPELVLAVETAVLYPLMADRISSFLGDADEKLPAELVETTIREGIDPHQAAKAYASRAAVLGADAVKLATVLASDCGSLKPKQLQARAEALELCRLWFTRALKVQVGLGNPFTLRLVPDEGKEYRLQP